MGTSMVNKNKKNVWVSIFFSTILFLSLYYIAWLMVTHMRLNFDEGYNLQIPLNLIRFHVYGSHTLAGFSAFDRFISSGPFLFIPVTLVIGTLGMGVVKARLISFAFFILLTAIIFILTRQQQGPLAAILSIGLIFTVSDSIYRSVTIVGDGAGILCIFVGFLILAMNEEKMQQKHLLLAGVFWGLSAWAKPTLMVGIGFLFAIFFLVSLIQKRAKCEYCTTFMFAVPIGLGWFILSTAMTWKTGSLFTGPPAGILEQQFYLQIGENLQGNLPVFFQTIGPASVIAILSNIYLDLKLKEKSFIVRAAGNLLPLCWMVWWLLFNRYSLERHLFPGLYFAIIPSAIFFARTIQSKWLKLLRVACIFLLWSGALPAINKTIYFTSHLKESYSAKVDQAVMARYVAELDPNIKVMGWDWHLAWDIAALSGKTLGDLFDQETIAPTENVYLIVTPTTIGSGDFHNHIAGIMNSCSGEQVFKSGEYELYSLRGPCDLK